MCHGVDSEGERERSETEMVVGVRGDVQKCVHVRNATRSITTERSTGDGKNRPESLALARASVNTRPI